MSCSSWSSTVLCEKANTDLVIVTDATYSEDTKACGVAAVLLDAEGRRHIGDRHIAALHDVLEYLQPPLKGQDAGRI